MYDFHVHSDFSIDCRYSMEDMVLKAIEKNMKCICFTDHIELEATERNLDIVFHAVDYFKKSKQVKYKYFRNIEILTGVEIGMQSHLNKRYDDFINENPFDYVLMSIHSVENKDIYVDNYLENKDPLDGVLKYYEEMLNSVNVFENYDILGHIDLIDRYFKDSALIPKNEEYEELIEKIFEKVISLGKGIELNTSGIRYGLPYYHPKIELLKLYKKLGGEIITIGSDAHRPEDVGYNYKEAEKLLRELGFKYIFIYKERKKFPIHIA